MAAAVLIGLGTAAGVSPAAGATETPFIDLGVLSGAVYSEAIAVNDHNLVVGLSSAGGPYGPSTWNRVGRLTVLPVLPDGTDVALPIAVNDRSEIIGRETTADGRQHALRWNRDRSLTDLRFPPEDSVLYPIAINNTGTTIGTSGSRDLLWRPIRWDRAGLVSELPALPGMRWTWATAINDRGTIVGDGYRQWSSVAVPGFWDRSGVPHLLDLPPGIGGAAVTDINERGAVVGGNVAWDPAGHATVLPGESASAKQINEHGTILGSAYLDGSGMPTAVRWRNGTLSQLALPPTGQWASATAQNNDDITIGDAALSPLQMVPVWWDRSGAVHRLACPKPNDIDYPCTAVAINDQGFAVGRGIVTTEAGGQTHALMWKLRP
ncbi:hypothetical protein [Amycolatopsis sp. NPDC021455]|uniref:hypothetical protein n=1 Tax=Amycolatopsis sp. NPDC021455 TaxID=3154901 RepID=UPI00340471BD